MQYIRIISPIIISLLTGCVLLFHFKEARKEEFSFYSIRAANLKIKTEGLYCRTERSENKTRHVIMKFNDTGLICHQSFGAPAGDTISDHEPARMIQIMRTESMNNKGYYYFLSDTMKMEILTGDAGHGYYFMYFDGFINGDTLRITKIGEKRYRNAMPAGSVTSPHEVYTFVYRP